jgi:F-type H+-transporting ATPase subunit a
MFLVQVFGFWSRGMGHLAHFFRFKSLRTKGIGMGLVDIFVGLIEGLSEFAKVISFSFRLFGNIFAGEVILIVMSSLVSLVLVVAFFGLEIFVGLIQAFVFFILSLAFFSLATAHDEEH